MRRFIVILIVFFPIEFFAQCLADTVFQIEQVTISAEQNFRQENAGSKAQNIDTAILQNKINRSIADILSENSSVFIKNNGRGALATISFRGTASSHTQVSWNGIKISNPMTGTADFSLIPVYITDKISLKYGNASMSESGGGLGGAIILDNQSKWSNGWDFGYTQTIGSFHTHDEFADISYGNKKLQIRSRIYNNQSENDYPFINRGIAEIHPETGEITHPIDTNKNAAYGKYGILQEIYFRPAASHIISLSYWGQNAKRTIPQATSYEGPDNSNRNLQENSAHKLVANWTHYTDKSRLSFNSGIATENSHYRQMNFISGLGEIPAIFTESHFLSNYNRLEYSHDFAGKFKLIGKLNGDFHSVTSKDTVTQLGYEAQRSDISLFVSLSKQFGESLNLALQIRESMIDGKLQQITPWFGIDFKPLKQENLIIKANISQNYHQPSLNDLYWQPGGNPELKPEFGFTGETGITYQKQFKNTVLQTELTAYYSDIENWILWVPSFQAYWTAKNVTRVISKGIEATASLQGNFGKVIYQVSGNYTLTKALNYGDPKIWGSETYGKQLVYIPVHSGNLFARLAYKGFSISWQHNAYSERFTTSTNDISRRDWLYPYFMNDLGVGKSHDFEKFSISAEIKIYNLFNETYHSILYRPMPGRNYMFILSLKF
ncbi:MAG: TonB-dependent receptor plug domain-containing protein [Bacteroidales bacterium]|jgi:outer membrane cobalamin receptor|nr:TonB-dependent receptor plug domain-containing protein [Bacteroidales bacterium]